MNYVIDEAKLIFKNFSGTKSTFNTQGYRKFGAIIKPEVADELRDLGVTVKTLKPKSADDQPLDFVEINVKLDKEPAPKVIMRKADCPDRYLDEDDIGILDQADIDIAHIQMSIRTWSMPTGKSGKNLWLNNIICVLNENDFLSRYNVGCDE